MSTAGMPSAAPHCAMHVSREMELREMGAPAWLAKPDGAEEGAGMPALRRAERCDGGAAPGGAEHLQGVHQ